MGLKAQLVRLAREVRAKGMVDPIERAGVTGFFGLEDLDEVTRIVFEEGTSSPRFEPLRHAHMRLPEWFRRDLDPYSPEYAAQQVRLWQAIAGVDRPYEPLSDEKEAPVDHADPVRFPAYFMRRDADAVRSASDHVIAGGMILKHSGLKPGDLALEYGAGFGQTALTLARLGVQVDTVDISETFCRFVQQQAEHFQVPLQAHFGRFGENPRPGHKYDLVWFYESFHHCFEWQALMQALPGLLSPGGRVLLCGEPMAEREYAAVPYPWGVRLHSEVVATIRRHRWFELGFSEDFLHRIFTRAGFSLTRHVCEPSLWGRTYVALPMPDELHMGQMWMPPALEDTEWHGAEADGRWTKGDARVVLRRDIEVEAVELDLANPSGRALDVVVACGSSSTRVRLAPGARCTSRVMQPQTDEVWLRCRARRPGGLRAWRSRTDKRELGVFVRRLRYVRSDGASSGARHE